MIIDMHIHPMLNRRDPEGWRARTDELIDCMGRAGVDKANVVPMLTGGAGLSSYYTESCVTFLADSIVKMISGNGDRFFSMIYVNPFLDTGFLTDIVKKYILNGPVNGIKLLAEMLASDERLEPFAAFLEKNGVPVLYHSWYNNNQGYTESKPCDIAALAAKFPGLRITMAHMRGARFRGIQDIKKHKNVWVDTSGSECEDGYLEYTLRELGPDRIIHGSDYPGRDLATARGRIESLDVPAEVREKIFARNAERFISG
jgi:hypothetical protein